MADSQLTATTGSGSQTTTQSPQTAGQPASSGTHANNLQPGTATSLLTSQSGVPLHATSLPTVTLNTQASSPSATTTTVSPAVPAPRHVHTTLFVIPAVLVVVAVFIVWVTTRSVKSTTE